MKIQVFMPTNDRHMRYKSQLTVALGVALLAFTTASGVSAQSAMGSKVAQAGQFVNNGQAYQVMQASQVPTAADRPGSIGAAINGRNPVQQVGCQSCGTSCGGACGGYSTYSEDFSGYGNDFSGYESIGHGSSGGYGNACSNACGIPCDPYCYVRVEALYMEREEDNRGLSRDLRLPDYDYEWASRVTVGSLPNCVNGFEVTYVGPLEWNTTASANDGAGRLGTILGPQIIPRTLAPFADDLRAFQNANPGLTGAQILEAIQHDAILSQLTGAENHTSQVESLRAEFWSLEANRTLVGWDVAKVLLGVRYIEYDEESLLNATRTDAPPTRVDALSQTDNQMFGAQFGLDLLYPVGIHAYTDFRARAGAYYNQADSIVALLNDNVSVAAVGDDSGGLAMVFELGTGIRYQLGEMLSVRAGTEMWYIDGVATANDQYRQLRFDTLNGTIGTSINSDDSFFVFGFNLAAELKF